MSRVKVTLSTMDSEVLSTFVLTHEILKSDARLAGAIEDCLEKYFEREETGEDQ